MRVVSTVHPSSSVVRSCKVVCTNGAQYLVLAYPDRVEAHVLKETGIERVASLVLHARVLDLLPLPSQPGRFLVTTDPPDPVALVLEVQDDKLVVVGQTDVKARGARVAEFFTGAFACESYAFSMHYKGRLNALKLDEEVGVHKHDSFDCPIRELNVLSACVVPIDSDEPVLAILHIDAQDSRPRLVTRALVPDEHDLGGVTEHIRAGVINDVETNFLVPVKNRVIAMGGSTVRLLPVHANADVHASPTRKKKRQSTKGKETDRDVGGSTHGEEPVALCTWEWGAVTTWTSVDEGRILVGDEYGRLVFIVITETVDSITMTATLCGQTSPATTLTYLDNGAVYVGSHLGDSQLVRLSTTANASGSYLTVTETFANIAPIIDAVVVDLQNTNQPQIVTCSGSSTTGSLRIVQKSAELDILGFTDEFPHTENVFPLRTHSDDTYHSWLLLSSHSATRLLSIEGEELSDVGRSAFIANEPTLAASNLVPAKGPVKSGPYVLQVTRSAAILIDMDGKMEIDRADFSVNGDPQVVVASCSKTQALLSLKTGSLVYISLENDKLKIMASTPPQLLNLRNQVAALNIEPSSSTSRATAILPIATYGGNTVHLKKTSQLLQAGFPAVASRKLAAGVRSVLLTDFGVGKDNVHLLAGCVNGTVVAIRVRQSAQDGTADYELDEPRTIGLGSLPVTLTRHGDRVFACGSVVTVLYWEQGRLQQSTLAVKDVTRAVPLHAQEFEDATIFIAPSALTFGRVQQVQRLHIKTIPLGLDNPKRIAHSVRARAFGVGCVRTEPVRVGDPATTSSSFRILDQDSFDTLNIMQLDDDEEVFSVACLPISPDDASSECFVVGSAHLRENEVEPSSGRILVFGSSAESGAGSSWLTAFTKVRGAVYALTSVDGLIVAGVNTSVNIYELRPNTISEAERAPALTLGLKTQWNHNYVVTQVTADDNLIYVGDAITSISILRWDGTRLQTVARHFAPIYPVALDVLSDKSVLAANLDHNLYNFRQAAPSDRTLEINGSFHLGDMVNKITRGSLIMPSHDPLIRPEQVFFTSTGRIGVVAEATEDASMNLHALERSLEQILDQDLPKHETWRAPHTENGVSDAQRSAAGFLDGDLLERFFDISPRSEEYERMMAAFETYNIVKVKSENDLAALLEQLQALH